MSTELYSLERNELAKKLITPAVDASGNPYNTFQALDEEWVLNEDTGEKLLNVDAYLERFFSDPKNEQHKNLLAENKPLEVPSYGKLFKETVWDRTAPMLKTGGEVAFNYAVKKGLGVSGDEDYEYISQDDYKKRIAEGQVPGVDFWKEFKDDKHRTDKDWRDWTLQALDVFTKMQRPGVQSHPLYLAGEEAQRKALKPTANEKLQTRIEWYDRGGEINEKGLWQDRNGKASTLANLLPTDEWSTKEKYEERELDKQPFFSQGAIQGLKQNILYEWINPAADGALESSLDRRLELASDAEYMEVAKWAKQYNWDNIGETWADGQLTKRTMYAIMNAAPSLIVMMGTGLTVQAMTGNPTASAVAAGTVGGLLDGSDTYIEAVDYGVNEMGLDRVQAELLAAQYYEAYVPASILWESLPFAKFFRKSVPDDKLRAALVKEYADKSFKKYMNTIAPSLVRGAQVSGARIKQAAGQGLAEMITELGQYTTQVGLEQDYKEEDFATLWDWNEAIDSGIGGFGAGAGMGVFGKTDV